VENAGENADTVQLAPPGLSGHRLRFGKGIGGKKGRSGRPRNEVRDLLVKEFAAQIPQLKRDVKSGKLDRIRFAEMCAKYGLGTTITETDTEGNDVTRPGQLTPDEQRAAILRVLSN
jgi:hypothetical protein